MIWWIVLGWFMCGMVQYLDARRHMRRHYRPWSRGSRAYHLLVALIGPFSLWLPIATYIVNMDRWKNVNRPARW